MDRDEKQKPMCKICGKSFPSGMSLGGHMRNHLVKKSNKKPKEHGSKLTFAYDDNDDGYDVSQYKKRSSNVSTDEISTAIYRNERKLVKKPKVHSKLAFVDEDDDDNQDGYVLSEYKKGSVKMSTDETSTLYENITKCKECGKEFPSVRSLCGHMRWHTVKKPNEKDNVCKKCGKGFDTMRALFGHMTHHSRKSRVLDEPAYSQSDSEGKVTENLYSSGMCSSSYDTDSDEIEQAAIILMMLSRGMTQIGSSNSVLKESKGTRFVHNVKIVDKKKNNMKRRKKLGSWGACSSFMFERKKAEFEPEVSDDRDVQDDDGENEFSGLEIKNKKRKRVQPGENFKVKLIEDDTNSVEIKIKGLKKSKATSAGFAPRLSTQEKV